MFLNICKHQGLKFVHKSLVSDNMKMSLIHFHGALRRFIYSPSDITH